MVDDVSAWDDEAPPVEPEARSIAPETLGTGDEELESDTEAPQRRRRRRRRGSSRRDRDEIAGQSPEGPRSEAAGDLPRTGRPPGSSAALPDDEDEAEDDWAGAELLDPVVSADRWSEPETFESQPTSGDEEAQPVRRSSRRRRRGGRGRERTEEVTGEVAREVSGEITGEVRESAEVREPRPLREPRPPREPRPVREPRPAREPSSREAGLREPSESRGPRDTSIEPAGPSERSRREPRTRTPRTVADAPRRELAAVGSDDPDDQVDSSLAAELEGDEGPNRHPKIPTWADSLEAIITSNMDNRRRGDSQRGGPPRGRPRGGGSGGGSSTRR